MYDFSARISAFVNSITLQKAYCICLFFILLEELDLILPAVSFSVVTAYLLSEGSVPDFKLNAS